MYVKMSPGVCTWSLPSSLPYVINLVGFGVSGALLKSQARWDLSLRSTAFGLTLSPSTKRQLLDGLCLLVTCSEVTGQSQLRENFLSSSTLILMDNTHTHTQLYRSLQDERTLVLSIYTALPLCPSDFLSLLLPRRMTFNLSERFPLSHQPAVSPKLKQYLLTLSYYKEYSVISFDLIASMMFAWVYHWHSYKKPFHVCLECFPCFKIYGTNKAVLVQKVLRLLKRYRGLAC